MKKKIKKNICTDPIEIYRRSLAVNNRNQAIENLFLFEQSKKEWYVNLKMFPSIVNLKVFSLIVRHEGESYVKESDLQIQANNVKRTRIDQAFCDFIFGMLQPLKTAKDKGDILPD